MVDDGDVKSVSAAVEVERLLEDDGSTGAEKVLDATDTADSCEGGSAGLCTVDGAIGKSPCSSRPMGWGRRARGDLGIMGTVAG